MKNILIITAVLFLFSSCTKNDSQENYDNDIYGTWQLIERFDGGSPNPNQPVENGDVITFNLDGAFANSSYNCDGNYQINNSIVEINMPCVTSNALEFSFSFDDVGNLLMTSYPNTCVEGCYDKYLKVITED
ncbi:lipocalin family protein [Pontimicrobium aquaticum]|uniref:Lipocalin-like domain-containing protein n=1 Tax=Pontimicrobium aquaticum TaxID=2565367 RepID=A0A4U0EQS9_9FLAO|nr:lipocalin family protein [Pontimicrobium aquaticum]TJY33888.1 hypothetical protein E5167_11220 [Pontimicrobium aquaticum]